jgi:hypothetical protein
MGRATLRYVPTPTNNVASKEGRKTVLISFQDKGIDAEVYGKLHLYNHDTGLDLVAPEIFVNVKRIRAREPKCWIRQAFVTFIHELIHAIQYLISPGSFTESGIYPLELQAYKVSQFLAQLLGTGYHGTAENGARKSTARALRED